MIQHNGPFQKTIYLMALVKLFHCFGSWGSFNCNVAIDNSQGWKNLELKFLALFVDERTCLWIHGTGKLYPTYWLISMVHVGKVTRPMDPIGVS